MLIYRKRVFWSHNKLIDVRLMGCHWHIDTSARAGNIARTLLFLEERSGVLL